MRNNYTEEQIDEVKKLFNLGFGERRISKIMNISRGSVSGLLKKLKLTSKNHDGKRGKDKIDNSNGKKCKNCFQIKSITDFRISRNKDRAWIVSICILCEKNINKITNKTDKQRATRKLYRKNNKDKLNAFIKARSKNDISFHLRKIISGSIRRQLKIVLSRKDNKSVKKYLPYTFEDLKIHLESQFEPWMNWSNWGKYIVEMWDDNDKSTWTWQIDHIIPHSTFKYISMKDQSFKECWALSNLRPYSAKQNVLDGGTQIRHKIT